MKKAVLILVVLAFIGILFIVSNHADNIEKQIYVSQVVIDAPWGIEPGQFGIYDPLEHGEGGPIVGPRTLTVAVNGDIYIYDAQNGRIQTINNSGQLISIIPLSESGDEICTDGAGNVYLYRTAQVPNMIIQ